MAILKHGVIGPFKGKVGDVVGYTLNGQTVIRSLPVYAKRKPSPLTLINRGRMAAVSKFLSPLRRVITFGYKHVAPKGSRVGTFQSAQSYIFKNAIAYGEGNVPYVDPAKVLVFRGDITPPQQVAALRKEQSIHISWDAQLCRGTDEVVLIVAYMPEHKSFLFEEGVARASQGFYDLLISSRLSEPGPIHIYLGFYNIRKESLSDSTYVLCE